MKLNEMRVTPLQGFIGFLPANVQMRHCMEIMEKIWRREDAELKSREDLWVKIQMSVKKYVRSLVQGNV